MLSVILSAAVISRYSLRHSHVYRCDLPSHTALYMGVGYERFVFVPASSGKSDHNHPLLLPPTPFYYFAGSFIPFCVVTHWYFECLYSSLTFALSESNILMF